MSTLNSMRGKPEGLEENNQVITEVGFGEVLKHYIDLILGMVRGGGGKGPSNAASLRAGIEQIKPQPKSDAPADSIQTTSAPSEPLDTDPSDDPEPPEEVPVTDTTVEETPAAGEEEYIWIPERGGNLWYATNYQAGQRLSKLKREGVCTDETCRIEEFKPASRYYSKGYRIALRDFKGPGDDDSTGTPVDDTPKLNPNLKGVEVHVNLFQPQKVRVIFEDPARETLEFLVSAGPVTEEVIDDPDLRIYKRPNPVVKLGRWGLLYFALFKHQRGMGFHSNNANPSRKTLCDEGLTEYCEPASDIYKREEWGLIVDGTPRSHGCVRLKHEDAPKLFNAVKNGTKVFVYKEAEWRQASWAPAEMV